MKYLLALALAAFVLPTLTACEANAPTPTSTVSEPRDCDQPSRDENGRPVDQC
jgi:hypothetical protein